MTPRLSRVLLAVLVILAPVVLATWAAAPASAHATLLASTPSDGTQLDASPSVLTFELSEPVSLVEGSVQLINADGDRCPLAAERLDEGRTRIVIEPAESLPDGAYLATARVVSADTHVVSLSIRFTVGAVIQQGEWGDLTGGSTVGRSIVLPVKTIEYLGTVLSAGLLLAARWAWPGVTHSRRFTVVYRIGAALLGAGLLGRGLILVVEQSGGLSAAWPAVSAVLSTPFGIALAAGAALAALTFTLPPGRNRPTALLGLAFAVTAVTAVTLGGHGGSTQLWPLPFLITFVHIYAVAVWLGGVSVIALVAPELPALHRWHRVAFGHVILLVAAGIGVALFQVRPLAAIVTTSYGLTLAVKVAAVGAAIAAGYLVYRKARAGDHARGRTILVEAVLAVVVIGVTSSLSSLTPAKDSYTTDVATTVDFGDADVLDVHIDTVRRGSQVVTIDIADSMTADIGVELSSPEANVARLPVEMTPVSAGEWRSDGLIVPAAGRWKVTVRFDDGSGPKLASFFYQVL
ncbi:copper resistance protein CopC [Mycobacterium sp. 236(2023)]|uniref:copper resistance CopC/CopD family protein n=1 Tax=Mycobacterium sp. 236(2023) TaxID=3038163 RepID=UPI0024154E15|nr:copper resistance protein CopC [Mycobacterium sp. 236(2023)]MDG4667618.1 copper resistance protein CopC [Mycobacterium sp. 236(2023)]